MIKDAMRQMKNDFLKSDFHRINILDILDGRLFDKEQENEKQKKKLVRLSKTSKTVLVLW